MPPKNSCKEKKLNHNLNIKKKGSAFMFVNVENVPQYAKSKKYLLVKTVDGVIWFHGAYDDANQAQKQMEQLNKNNNIHFLVTQ